MHRLAQMKRYKISADAVGNICAHLFLLPRSGIPLDFSISVRDNLCSSVKSYLYLIDKAV